MEHECGLNGLSDLNPQYLWKFVRINKRSHIPAMLYYKTTPQNVEGLNYWRHTILTEAGTADTPQPNVRIVWADNLPSVEFFNLCAMTDYFYCPEEYTNEWLAAMLCGASVVHDKNAYESAILHRLPLSLVGRIENWDKAQELLTKHKHL